MLDWKELMTQWSLELRTTDLVERVATAPTNWLGFDSASPSTIAELESRLGLRLPPSYRSFLAVSNGWGRLDRSIAGLRPASAVDWFVTENEHWAEVYADSPDVVDQQYLSYADDGTNLTLCGQHTGELVQISDVDDAVILLNPLIQSSNGEWEAWFFANWIPGANRFASFAHLMLAQFRSMRTIQQVPDTGYQIPRLPIPPWDDFQHRTPARLKAKRKAANLSKQAGTWAELVGQLSDDVDRPNSKLLRKMAGKLKGRFSGKRDAELTERLSEIFRRTGNPVVRSLCIQAVTEFAPDGTLPSVLREAYEDPDVGVMLSAVFSHEYFPQPDAVEILCRLLRRDMHPLYKENMICILGDLSDRAAIPTLKDVLFDTDNEFDQTFGTIGGALGRIGPDAFDVLIEASSHPDRRIRLAAAIGLDVSGDPRATPVLDQLVNDSDSAVRTRAAQRIGRMFLG